MGIGKGNDLLWHISEDLKRFRNLTMGNAVIMGKKTWESLPKKPLAGRRNIVITDLPGETFAGAIAAYSVEDAVEKCSDVKEVFIIGGGSIYRQFMPLAHRLYITHVHRNTLADVYFPSIDMKDWKILEKTEFITSGETAIPYTYVIYERK